jgi:hypothetical protein
MRVYLKDRDRVFSTGCFLTYDEKNNCFRFYGIEEDTYFDGKLVNFDEEERPFIEKDEA